MCGVQLLGFALMVTFFSDVAFDPSYMLYMVVLKMKNEFIFKTVLLPLEENKISLSSWGNNFF